MRRELSRSLKYVRTVLQYESAECGAASLATVLKYFGRIEPLRLVRDRCGVNRDGSKASNIAKAARTYGLDVKAYTTNAESCKTKSNYPCIIFWSPNHFLIVEGFKGDQVYLSDPARGRVKISYNEFEKNFTGIVLELLPNEDFVKGGKEESLFKRIWKYVLPYKSELISALGLSLAIVIPNIFIASLTSIFIDSFLQSERLYFGVPIIWLMLIASLVLATLLALRYLILRRVENIYSKRLTTALFEKLTRVPINFYQVRFQGEVALRMLLGLSTAQILISQIITFLVDACVSLVIMIFVAFISPILTLMVLAITAINIAFNAYLTNIRESANIRLALEKGKATGKGIQGLTNIEMIKSSGLEYDFLSQWQATFGKVVYETQLLGTQMAYSNILSQSSSFMLSALVITIGGILIVIGHMTLGGLLAFQFLQSDITRPINTLPSLNNAIQQFIGDLGRLDDLMTNDEDPMAKGLQITKLDDQQVNNLEKLKGKIQLKNVSYSFDSLSQPFLNDINLTIEAGTMASFVGASGSGKSTLIALIAGLQRIKQGEILFDDNNRNQYDQEVMTGSLAYVAQKIFVFNTSIWNNITLWDPKYNLSDLEQASKDAEIYSKIVSHPEAFERELLDSGRDLSGGEKQRIEIARSLVKSPTIIILDEATSALDNRTQEKVIENIRNRGITILNISHRLQTAMKSDIVYVLDKGVIVEQGNPKSLLAKESIFKQFADSEQKVEA
ncbi:cysteine peptidase family C39 domain-containing protein [Prochlorococcus marinus]|uniref:Uncharacterized protein n=1 Tax=Prochlorococcus marinus (strain MIT 9303) TaxID=59922 RepID=A2CA05_PROM3|nr:cysteine peptidase family C39 domain-containing protein [Prochlorococcus marinus]ABM78315.1 Hypothetical protein P9303_15711 [Prochlorococcus marinus str. MIT 9303]